MDASSLREELERSGVVLVVRLRSAEHLDEVVTSAAAAGVRLVEITSNTSGGLEWLKSATSGTDVTLGVGTVTDGRVADAALDAGAEFLVSPNVDTSVLQMSMDGDTAFLSGALTPTEVVTAYTHGAAAVKLFPITHLGPGYVTDLRGPLPEVPLVPIGGIDEGNAHEFIRAGAVAVGVGGAFVNDAIVAKGEWTTLVDRLTQLMDKVAEARQTSPLVSGVGDDPL